MKNNKNDLANMDLKEIVKEFNSTHKELDTFEKEKLAFEINRSKKQHDWWEV